MTVPDYLRDVLAKGVEATEYSDPREITIDCRDHPVTDADLANIAQERDLTRLTLYGCEVSNSGVRKLSANRRLDYLDIGLTLVTGEVLEIVPLLPALSELYLEGVKQIHSGIRFMMNHPALVAVDFTNSDVTADDLRTLLINSNINHVNVNGTGIVPSDVADLDDIDADPYRTVSVFCSGSKSIGICMKRTEYASPDADEA